MKNKETSVIVEEIIGKVRKKAKDHADDTLYASVALNTLKELLSIFSGYSNKRLPSFFQKLID